MATLAHRPRASTIVAVQVNPRLFRNCRIAKRVSCSRLSTRFTFCMSRFRNLFITQRQDGINPAGALRWDESRQTRHDDQYSDAGARNPGIVDFDAVKLSRDQTAQCDRSES